MTGTNLSMEHPCYYDFMMSFHICYIKIAIMTSIFKIGYSFLKHKNMQNYGNVMNIYVFFNDSYMSYEMVCSILNELKLILTFGYMLTISVTFRCVPLNVTFS